MSATSIGLLLLRGELDGPRIVESRTSALRVHAGPWAEVNAILAAGVPAAPGFYLFTGRNPAGSRLMVRPGEAGDLRRRLIEHSQDRGKTGFEEVFCVSAVDSRLTKSDARYLEARCHEIVAASAHATLQVDKIPLVGTCGPAEQAVLETLLRQSRDLLHAAGCRGLDAPRFPCTMVTDDRDDGAVEIVQAGGVHPDEHLLSYDNIWAWGYPTVDGKFVVRAGSDVRRRENTALLPPVAARRKRLAELGLLGEMAGVTDRWRLLANIEVSSPLLAAKTITGAHVSNRTIWQRLAPNARIMTMDQQ